MKRTSPLPRGVWLLVAVSVGCSSAKTAPVEAPGPSKPRRSDVAAHQPPPAPVAPPRKKESLGQRVDALRKADAVHIDALRRLEMCGLYMCADLATLTAHLHRHRAKKALRGACDSLAKERSLFPAWALKPGKLKAAKRQKDPARDRVVDCRIVRDGERILRVQIVATATWIARIDEDLIAAADRYATQGRVSARLARRMATLDTERRQLRAQLQPHFAASGVTIPDDELFETVARASERYDKAVADAAGTRWTTLIAKDPHGERLVRKLFAPQLTKDTTGKSAKRVVAVGMHGRRWQQYFDAAGRAIRQTRAAEVVVQSGDSAMCQHRYVVLFQALRGPHRRAGVQLRTGDDVRFSRCKLDKPKTP